MGIIFSLSEEPNEDVYTTSIPSHNETYSNILQEHEKNFSKDSGKSPLIKSDLDNNIKISENNNLQSSPSMNHKDSLLMQANVGSMREEIFLSDNLECLKLQQNTSTIGSDQYQSVIKNTTPNTDALVATSSSCFVTELPGMTHRKSIMSQVQTVQDQCVEENSTLASITVTDTIMVATQRAIPAGPTKNSKEIEHKEGAFIARAEQPCEMLSAKNINIINFNEQPVTMKAVTIATATVSSTPPLIITSATNAKRIARNEQEEQHHDVGTSPTVDLSDRSDVHDTFTLADEYGAILNDKRSNPKTLVLPPAEQHILELCTSTTTTFKSNDANVTSSIAIHDDDRNGVDELSLNNYNDSECQILYKKNEGYRSLNSENIIERDVQTNALYNPSKTVASGSELNEIIENQLLESKRIGQCIEKSIELYISAEPSNEMKLDMKSSGKGVTLPTTNTTRWPSVKTADDNVINLNSNTIPSATHSNALKNFRSTAIDLPRFEPTAVTLNNARIKPEPKRTISIDTALDTNVLPERTRLRRQQRRFRSQDEPDDPIERLNRLKARISGALSEVKGVLQQYSTDNDEEEISKVAVEKSTVAFGCRPDNKTPEQNAPNPIQFRFVKNTKLRRTFAEDDENVALKSFEDLDSSKIKTERKTKLKDFNDVTKNKTALHGLKAPKVDNLYKPSLSTIPQRIYVDRVFNSITKNVPTEIEVQSKALHTPLESKVNSIDVVKNDDTAKIVKPKKEFSENQLNLKSNTNDIQNSLNNSNARNRREKETREEAIKTKGVVSQAEIQITENNKCNLSEPVQSSENEESLCKAAAAAEESGNRTTPMDKEELISKNIENLSETIALAEEESQKEIKSTGKGKLSKANIDGKRTLYTVNEDKEDNKLPEIDGDNILKNLPVVILQTGIDDDKKTKRKVLIKRKEDDRRASIAAVESSKIQTDVPTLAVPAQIKRRPSDSEAIVRKKVNITTKLTNTSYNTNAEVTSKPKIIKVKRTAIKKMNEPLQPIDKESINSTQQTNISNVNEIKENASKSARVLSSNSNNVLMPSNKATTPLNKENIEIVSNQLPINEAFLDRVIAKEQSPSLATSKPTTTKVQPTNETSNAETCKMSSTDLKEHVTGTVLCSLNDNNLKELVIGESTIIKQELIGKPSYVTEQQQRRVEVSNNLNKQNAEATQPAVKVENLLQKQEQQVVNTSKQIQVNISGNITKKTTAKLPQTTNALLINDFASHSPKSSSTDVVAAATADDLTKINYYPPITNSSQKNIQPDTTTDQLETLVIATPPPTVEPSNNICCTEELLVKETKMPEQQIFSAPIQAADIIPEPEIHKNRIPSPDKIEINLIENNVQIEINGSRLEDNQKIEKDTNLIVIAASEDNSIIPEEGEDGAATVVVTVPENAPIKPKKERKIKKKVIIKRQKRRLSITDSFFQNRSEEPSTSDTETIEKPIAFVTDDEDDKEPTITVPELEKQPLKSCMKVKEYEIGDEVLYPERVKKTQIKWKRGKIKERITSISYLIDVEGKEVSSHVNYLKKYTNRKVIFVGKEYLEIDYEQLAEEEEKAEILRKRTQSIWNMV